MELCLWSVHRSEPSRQHCRPPHRTTNATHVSPAPLLPSAQTGGQALPPQAFGRASNQRPPRYVPNREACACADHWRQDLEQYWVDSVAFGIGVVEIVRLPGCTSANDFVLELKSGIIASTGYTKTRTQVTCHQTLVVRPCLTHGRVSQVSRSSWANKFVEAATEQTSGEEEDGGGWCALLPISGGQRKDTDSSSSVYCTISYFARHILVLAPEGIEPVRRQKGSPQRLAGARCVPVVTSTSLLRTAADANCVCSRPALLQQLYSFCDECRDTDSTSVHAITSLVGHATSARLMVVVL